MASVDQRRGDLSDSRTLSAFFMTRTSTASARSQNERPSRTDLSRRLVVLTCGH